MKRFSTLLFSSSFLLLLVVMFMLAGCTTFEPTNSASTLNGRILVWHSWDNSDTAVLQDLVANFSTLHPDVTVTVIQVPANQLANEYLNATPLGFGPDLLIIPSESLDTLFQQGTLRNITADLNEGYEQIFLPQSLALGQINDYFYAFPLSLRPMGLFYNQELVDAVPPNQTFDSLVIEASNGRPLGISSNPEPAYMGIGAFGEGMFTADNQLAADQTGLVNWLTWLNNNASREGVVVTQDEVLLRERFVNGRLAYYPAFYDDWELFSKALDTEEDTVVGVAPLPQGPFGLARPLLRAEMLAFNPTSSDRQYETALALANFLVNQEQNRRLMRETKRVPANQLVRIDNTVYPQIAAFAAQGRTAVSIPPGFAPYVLGPNTAALYTSVLSGVRAPAQAVCEYQTTIVGTIEGRSEIDLSACAPPESGTPAPTSTAVDNN